MYALSNYPWKNIDPKDFIQIEAKDTLTLKDVHVLTKLYQPLIGAHAYNLYLNLFAALDFEHVNQSTTVSELLRRLDYGIPDFFQARVKLEGIGLLRTYRSKEQTGAYIYALMAPLSAENFFRDSLLRTLLAEKIGERLFEEEVRTLMPELSDKSTYEDTTRSFLDVYHFDFQNTSQLNQTDFITENETPKRPKLAETIENVESFDYNFFKQGLNNHFVNKESLTKEIKELIYTFHVVYNIDELTMQQLILESADVDSGKVDAKKLMGNVEVNYANKQKARMIKNTPTQETESVANEELQKKGFSTNEAAIIRHAKQSVPIEYLESIKEQKSSFVAPSERYLIQNLIDQSPLSKEVINILMNYILVINNNPMLDKNYTMKIASDWAQSGVRSAEEAIAKIKEIYSKPKNQSRQGQRNYSNYRRQPIQKEKLPDWAKEKNKNTAADDQVGTDKQAESIQDRIDRLRKLRQQKEDN